MLTEAFVAALKSARVAVIGDVMVDHYVYGAVQRISPEAPVPVLHVAGERYVLGGAANVAANIAAAEFVLLTHQVSGIGAVVDGVTTHRGGTIC
jgi:bifunctional ADP-heptose synthase (sugar kinase/adenylyltransferase)